MMSKAVKNMLLGGFVLVATTSCSTLKRSATPAKTTASGTARSHAPRFIENISIKSGDFSRGNKMDGAYMPALVSSNGEMMASPLSFKYAILLDVPVEEVIDQRMYDFIESWYGTRYRYGGSTKDGIDCSAFAQTFLSANYNLSIPRTSVAQYDGSKRVRKEELQEGDLVFFHTSGRRNTVSHVGVYLRNNKFVHASTSAGVIITDLRDSYYAARYVGAGRVR